MQGSRISGLAKEKNGFDLEIRQKKSPRGGWFYSFTIMESIALRYSSFSVSLYLSSRKLKTSLASLFFLAIFMIAKISFVESPQSWRLLKVGSKNILFSLV